MHSTTTNTSTAVSAATFRPPLPQQISPNPNQNSIQFKPNPLSNHHSISINSNKNQITVTPPQPPPPSLYFPAKLTVTEKLKILVSEFKSLPEPIDRVKKLLHYASLLPEFENSLRTESNRVTGCTAQVWLEAIIADSNGTIRFRVDSDSEITKGFCYCLIWLLDGEKGEEVIKINVEDLKEMNVGITPIRVSSRVNTWHHVLLAMQNKTITLLNLN
uniref:sufE-like protein 2, chloroplastic n=1 Tax=Erigeron canadensis TaxID=72917 RepID=UPI001CB96B69|nr:sufE-like protein 2, chloroplastic [Erigeron canadensis]